MSTSKYLLPRLIRLRDIPQYLGMDRRLFDKLARPYLTIIPIGTQGKAFDRLDLDKWVDQYKEFKGIKPWLVKERLDSLKEERSGILTSKFSDKEFVKAFTLSHSKKPNNI